MSAFHPLQTLVWCGTLARMRWTFRKTDAVGFGLAVAVAATTFILSGRGQPTAEHVSGRYSSACCGVMIISPHSVEYSGETANLTFYHMKFGLTAYADRAFGPFYGVSDGQRQPPTIYFNSPDAFSVATYEGQTAEFRRIK